MFEDNQMLSINVKLWKFLSVILAHNWRSYLFVAPVFLLNAMQFAYLFSIWGDLAAFIMGTFFAAAIFDALLRTCLVIINRDKFEAFMTELATLYREIEESNDVYVKSLLKEVTMAARKISIFNLSASFIDLIGALLMPLFSGKRIHPIGVAIPGVDMLSFPVYHIVYILQIPSPLVLTAMYMPFVSLFAAFAMFGKTMLIILQHKLRQVCQEHVHKSESQKYEDLIKCIRYHARISSYVKQFNSLVTYIVFVEFILFGTIICSLLFCLNIVVSFTQIITVIMYIFTMLYVLFTYYWQANELLTESLKVSEAAYDMAWYQCSPRFKKTLLLFIMISQKPLKIMVGNIQPMTLETFQSLLNASYSYFSVLRGVYN